jgi:hypothetical protein
MSGVPQKVTKLIKHRGDKGRIYDVIPLDWVINNYDVYNRNRFIETVIFYTYYFYLTWKFKKYFLILIQIIGTKE